ncbi:type I inositol -C4-5-trisphosphate 5-phosphatase [Crotalus adamanteus]|uniref:inositol-polyphosphate 5-phosphatase n=1 Tax=Crotalus adamanteus TaxID=8729 RepID=A0AAW1BFY4_CROAD
MQKNWLREFYQIVHAHKPQFMALHCQEFGGKNYEASMSHVDKFVKELLSSDAMKDYNRARVYLDENFKSQEHFTALGSFYFLHESLKNIYQFDFKAKKYKKVTGKEIYSDTLESTPMLEKEKFPQDYFPECKWSRKGFIRTRWCITDCAFDLVNIHLFHDASNLVAWETSPSVYSGIRHKALSYVLDRIIDQRFERVSYFIFGDFNFRLDSKSVVETLCAKATMQTIRAADTNEVVKLIFRESDNDRKVMLQLEKKLFDYFNQDVFRDNNGTALLEFDKELSVFKDKLYELDISFPPSYPYSEDCSQGMQYMNTRCPAWCDRILMSHSAKELILKSENDERQVVYDHIGPNVCMGDHKPVFLSFRIPAGAVTWCRKKMPPTGEDISGKFIIARRKRRRKTSNSHPSLKIVTALPSIQVLRALKFCHRLFNSGLTCKPRKGRQSSRWGEAVGRFTPLLKHVSFRVESYNFRGDTEIPLGARDDWSRVPCKPASTRFGANLQRGHAFQEVRRGRSTVQRYDHTAKQQLRCQSTFVKRRHKNRGWGGRRRDQPLAGGALVDSDSRRGTGGGGSRKMPLENKSSFAVGGVGRGRENEGRAEGRNVSSVPDPTGRGAAQGLAGFVCGGFTAK